MAEIFFHRCASRDLAGDHSFIFAADALNKLIVIDSRDRDIAGKITPGVRPHPGRGANLTHPKDGPVWATGNTL